MVMNLCKINELGDFVAVWLLFCYQSSMSDLGPNSRYPSQILHWNKYDCPHRPRKALWHFGSLSIAWDIMTGPMGRSVGAWQGGI